MAHTPLKEKYKNEVVAELMKELGITNKMAVPKITKIVINSGIGKEAQNNSNVGDEYAGEIAIIAGQKPVITKSKKAISNFKLRVGMDSGIMVTLRGDKMWDFLDRLINVVLPRVKDFQGVPRKLDGNGNYSLGIREHIVFPEIDTSKMLKIRPLQVVITTTATDNKAGFALLEKLGMPFKKERKAN